MTSLGRVLLSSFVAAFLAPAAVLLAQESQPPIIVKELAVQGNRRVQEAVILGRVRTKVGSPFSPTVLAEDIRNVFALGFFDDVQALAEDFEGGIKIVFVVAERPFIRDIAFSGNRRISTSTLQEKIDLKLGGVYNPVEAQRAAQKLRDHYEDEGYFEAEVSPEIERVPDGDVKVVFRITEGRRITIDRIVIEGAKGLTPKEIKSVMATQERQYFILRGVLQRQRLEEDVERILALYNDHGYLQARVESHDITIDRERARVTITIKIVEGPQFTVGKLDVGGTSVLPVEEVRRQITLKPGEPFSRSQLRESLQNIRELYSTIGRPSAEVNPVTIQDFATRKVNVTFEIVEGPEVFVERINISGNVRSQEKILRREIPMHEGDLFTSAKLARARQRLNNLGFFDTVNASTAPGSAKDKIIVNIEVTERATGLFSVGGGFSSAEGFLGTVDLSQRNFLGRGWETTFRVRAGGRTQQGTISFTEPWLFDRPLSAGFDVFNNRNVFSDYTINSLGGDLRLSHPFFEFWRWFVTYRLTQDKVSDVPTDASSELKDQEGTTVTSAIGGSMTWDARDNVFAPTTGGRFSLTTDVAGLGGDNKFVKTVSEFAYFYPVFWGTILASRLELGYGFGYAGKDLPLFQRFFLGGPNSIRSFKTRQVSPVDSSGNRIGGTSEILFNIEHIIPVGFGIRLAAFVDIGNVYGFTQPFVPTDLHYAAGPGFRWQSPFGPVRVDWGFNLNRGKGERSQTLQFTVGSPF